MNKWNLDFKFKKGFYLFKVISGLQYLPQKKVIVLSIFKRPLNVSLIS